MRKSQPRNGKYKDSNGDFRTKVYIYQIKTSKDRLNSGMKKNRKIIGEPGD